MRTGSRWPGAMFEVELTDRVSTQLHAQMQLPQRGL